jgi:hypothetical protein
MKTKRLKRKQKARPGGWLKPVGSEIGGECMILDYRLQRAAEEVLLLTDKLAAIARNIMEVRRKLSPNDQAHT